MAAICSTEIQTKDRSLLSFFTSCWQKKTAVVKREISQVWPSNSQWASVCKIWTSVCEQKAKQRHYLAPVKVFKTDSQCVERISKHSGSHGDTETKSFRWSPVGTRPVKRLHQALFFCIYIFLRFAPHTHTDISGTLLSCLSCQPSVCEEIQNKKTPHLVGYQNKNSSCLLKSWITDVRAGTALCLWTFCVWIDGNWTVREGERRWRIGKVYKFLQCDSWAATDLLVTSQNPLHGLYADSAVTTQLLDACLSFVTPQFHWGTDDDCDDDGHSFSTLSAAPCAGRRFITGLVCGLL